MSASYPHAFLGLIAAKGGFPSQKKVEMTVLGTSVLVGAVRGLAFRLNPLSSSGGVSINYCRGHGFDGERQQYPVKSFCEEKIFSLSSFIEGD
eukprot:scaffold42688_cov34-Cyclotella_meneghiniana.AAC.1